MTLNGVITADARYLCSAWASCFKKKIGLLTLCGWNT